MGDYKASYFRERSSLSQFTRYMIAIINNCDRFEVLSQEMKSRWWKPGQPGHGEADGSGKFEMLLKTFQDIRLESVSYLLDEAFLDIEAYFSDLFTAKWQTSNQALDTICATLNDYFEDYQFLKPSLRAGDHDGAGPRGSEVHHGDASEQPPAPQDQLHLQRGAQVRSLQDQEGGRAGQVILQRCCWGDGRLRFSF